MRAQETVPPAATAAFLVQLLPSEAKVVVSQTVPEPGFCSPAVVAAVLFAQLSTVSTRQHTLSSSAKMALAELRVPPSLSFRLWKSSERS